MKTVYVKPQSEYVKGMEQYIQNLKQQDKVVAQKRAKASLQNAGLLTKNGKVKKNIVTR